MSFNRLCNDGIERRSALEKVVRAVLSTVLAILAIATAVLAQDKWVNDYQRLLKWRVHSGVAVPQGGINFTLDAGTWHLETGTVRAMEDLNDGFVPGFVFEGKGRFIMEIPDAFEVEQLRRFSKKKGLMRVEEAFTKLVMRTTLNVVQKLMTVPQEAYYEESKLLKDRSEEWLKRASKDLDARVIAGHLIPGDEYLLVDMDTESLGWVAFEFDITQEEEVALIKLQKMNDWVEYWVSMDRSAERSSTGRPTSVRRPAIDITKVDIEVNLMQHSGSTFQQAMNVFRDKAIYSATIVFIPKRSGARAVQLYLTQMAKVTRVFEPGVGDLAYLREHIGERFREIDKEIYDGNLTILLSEPLETGKERKITVNYEMKQYNYASGRTWYPGEEGGWDDLHEARITFRLPSKMKVRCVGEQVEEKKEGDMLISTWSMSKPTKALGYTFGKDFREERIKQEGVPDVVAFGSSSTAGFGNMVRNVAIDISNALRFYQVYFDVKFPMKEMQVTCISGYHGQAFEGLLHLAQDTFDAEHPGETELFRAHEAAHAIWGHMVGWKTYRDQWLSEAFAEYSAMLFVETAMAKNKYFEEILQIYSNEQTGSLKGSMSRFARPWNVGLSSDQLKEMGPISAGWRASTALIPQAYQIQAYNKGALVLHMLRTILFGLSQERDLFREVMQEFLKKYMGKEASTDDFRRIIEAKTGASWKSFFDMWVDGTSIPNIKWSHQVASGAGGKSILTIKVEVSDAPADFAQHIPVEVELQNGKVATIFLYVKAPETTQSIDLPAKPKKVTFAPRYSILGKIK